MSKQRTMSKQSERTARRIRARQALHRLPRRDENENENENDARLARDSRESRRFVAADADDEPRIASPRSGYGSMPPEASFSSHSPFVGVTPSRRDDASGNADGESHDFHLGGGARVESARLAARVPVPPVRRRRLRAGVAPAELGRPRFGGSG